MFELSQTFSIITRSCSIESLMQIEQIAETLVDNNVEFISGGAYKPRTLPYDF